MAGRSLRENHGGTSLIGRRFSVGRVVDLKNQVGAGGDQLGHPFGPCFGRGPGSVNLQDVGFGETLYPCFPWLPNVNDNMMDHSAGSRPHFDRLDPAVFFKSEGDDEALVVDWTLRRDLERLRHRENGVGDTQIPTGRPIARRGRGLRVARRGSRVNPLSNRVDFRRA